MALTADLNYKTVNPVTIDKYTAGAADTLYKGAIINIGVDGFAKVAADVASEYPAGINARKVIAAGANAETLDVESGTFRLWKATQHKLTVHVTDDTAANNAKFNSKYFCIANGTQGYYVWFNIAAGGVDPAPATLVALGYLGVEVAATAINTDAEIAALLKTALEGIDASASFVCTVATHIVTVTCQHRGYTITPADGSASAVITTTSTVMSGAQQSDIGTMFYAKADDGVVYASEVSNITPLGQCVGICGLEHLWINTRIKAKS